MPTVPVRAAARPLSQLLTDVLRAWFEPVAGPPAPRRVAGSAAHPPRIARADAAFRPVARPLGRQPAAPPARPGGRDPYAGLDTPTYQRRGMRIAGLPTD